MSTEELNAVAELASEKTAKRILAALGIAETSAPTTGVFLHSLTCEDFGICTEHSAEFIRRLIRCRSARIPRKFVTGQRPYKLDGKLLALWNVTPALALARLAAAKAAAQNPPPSASQSSA